jgi:cell division protein FtsW (lipid II flippase)
MNRWITWFFVVALALGSTIYLAQSYDVQLPNLVNNYVNDLLIVPIVLTLCLYFMSWLKQDDKYRLPLYLILYISAIYAVLFELILPNYYQRYTADTIDVMLYFLGGFFFYGLQRIESV